MKRRIKFELLSGVISCGIKTDNNFLVTEDIINGAVLRAAFANDILLDCPFAEDITDGRKYIVSYKGEKCGDCPHSRVCEKFSEMTFSFLVPENSMPSPFTSKTCKFGGTSHCVMDTLMENGILKCSCCGQRMENLKGIINREDHSAIKITHSQSTHTSIDRNTGTVLDGSLFSIEAIKKGCVYECEIDDCGSGMLEVGKVIYIGKYSSNGYGKIRIISIEDIPESNVRERIKRFNERFGESGSTKYASLLLLSDAKLDIMPDSSAPLSTEEYRGIWQEKLFGQNAPVRVEQVYAQNIIYNGFDNSDISCSGRPNRTEILTERGSSIKISFDADNADAAALLEELEAKGIGRDTNVGYGQVRICDEIHMKGVNRE